MSEEASDLTTGPAPGKRPLDLSSNLSSDPDDSALAPKRAKVADENCRDDNLHAHNAMSNGGLDSPSQETPSSNNKSDLENNDSPAEPQPRYVAEAEAERREETNGETENSVPSVQSNSEESASHNASSNVNAESDNKANVDSLQDKHKDISDHHKEMSNSPSVSDVDPNRTENEISGSCNGESKVQQSNSENDSVTAKDSVKGLEGAASVNNVESDDEAMDVDVENDSAEDLSKKVDTSNSPKASETSVPKDSSDAVTDKADSDRQESAEMDVDTQNDGANTQSDSKDKSLETNQNKGEKQNTAKCNENQKESSEKSGIPDSTSNLEEEEDNFKENDDFVDCLHLLSSEQQDARIVIMKKLHEELRNEETKLLLLKKLRLSQQQPVSVPNKQEGTAANVNGAAHHANTHRAGLPINMAHSSTSGKPHASIQPQSNSSHRSDMPQLMRGTHLQQRPMHNYQKGHSGPPPLIMAQQPNRSSSSSSSQSSQMVRAPVVRISTSAPASSTSTSSVSRSIQHQQQSSRQSQMANDGQSAASRQAAAKLALRKQLEKTLLQIPPPKPPPPELHFLPSAANNEFVILVGLEEVVNTILDLDKKDKNQSKGFIQPFKCAQCNTDFTTIWKQDPKQGIMCESCIVSNQKKALKAEHTNRLKTAFVKALQQEQEIEQRIQSQSSQSSSRVSSSSSSSVSRHRPPAVVHRSHGSSIHHSSSSSHQHKQRVMNPAPSQRVVQPIHYAYIPNLPVSAPQIQIIPKQHMLQAHRSSADRQREYLLDMIPPSKGLGHPQNPVIWKR